MILQLNGVNAFYGASQILFGVNVEVEEADSVCVLGRNGVGEEPGHREHPLLRRRAGGASRLSHRQKGNRLRAPGAAYFSNSDHQGKPDDGGAEGAGRGERLESGAGL